MTKETVGSRVRSPVSGSARVVVEAIDDSVDPSEYCRGEISELCNTYPLKVMVPTHASSNNCKWIYPITFGGGLVGGDKIDMNIHVKRGCCALLTGQESTKIYHCPENLESTQVLNCHIEEEALLCVMPDPVVCYRDAIFSQKQVLHMSSLGNLVYLDWMIGGRVALDELWQFDSYHNRVDLFIDDQLVYKDIYHLSSQSTVSLQDAMKQFQVQGSCIMLGRKLEEVSSFLSKELGKTKQIGEQQDSDLICSVSQLRYNVNKMDIKGVYIRFLASSSAKAYESCLLHIVGSLEKVLGGNPFEGKYKYIIHIAIQSADPDEMYPIPTLMIDPYIILLNPLTMPMSGTF